jgi:hypothetical protein
MASDSTRTITLRFATNVAGALGGVAAMDEAISRFGKNSGLTRAAGGFDKLSKATAPLTGMARKVTLLESAITLVGKVGPALVKLSGVLGLIPGLIGVAAGAMVVLKLGAAGVQKAFQGVATTTEKSVSAAFTKSLAPAAKNVRTLLHALTPEFDGEAVAISGVVTGITKTVTTSKDLGALKTIMGASQTATKNLGAAFPFLIDAVLQVVKVAAPAFASLTKGAGGWAKELDARISELAKNGGIKRWIDNGITEFKSLKDKAVAGFGQLTQIVKAFAGIKFDLFSGLAQVLLPVLVSVGNFLTAHPDLAAWIAGIGVALVAVSKAIAAVNVVLAVFDVLADLNPVGLAILLIGLLIVAFVVLWTKCKGFRDFWKGLWTGLKEMVTTGVNGIKTAWNNLVNAWNTTKKTIGSLVNQVGGFFSGLSRTVGNVVHGITGFFSGLGSSIHHVIDAIVGWFEAAGRRIAAPFIAAFHTIKAGIADVQHAAAGVTTALHVAGIPGFASGGVISAGQLALVGENGPELIRPAHATRVTPAGPTAAALSGSGGGWTGDIVIPIDLGNGVQQVIRIANKELKARVRAGARR